MGSDPDQDETSKKKLQGLVTGDGSSYLSLNIGADEHPWLAAILMFTILECWSKDRCPRREALQGRSACERTPRSPTCHGKIQSRTPRNHRMADADSPSVRRCHWSWHLHSSGPTSGDVSETKVTKTLKSQAALVWTPFSKVPVWPSLSHFLHYKSRKRDLKRAYETGRFTNP